MLCIPKQPHPTGFIQYIKKHIQGCDLIYSDISYLILLHNIWDTFIIRFHTMRKATRGQGVVLRNNHPHKLSSITYSFRYVMSLLSVKDMWRNNDINWLVNCVWHRRKYLTMSKKTQVITRKTSHYHIFFALF